MREAYEDQELAGLERLAADADGDVEFLATEPRNRAFIAAAREAVPVLVRDVREARNAAEQAIGARAVKLDARHVLIIYAGEEGPIKVADKLEELAERAKKAERAAELAVVQMFEVKDIAGEARAKVRELELQLRAVLEERERCRTLLVRSHLVAENARDFDVRAAEFARDVWAYLQEVANA